MHLAPKLISTSAHIHYWIFFFTPSDAGCKWQDVKFSKFRRDFIHLLELFIIFRTNESCKIFLILIENRKRYWGRVLLSWFKCWIEFNVAFWPFEQALWDSPFVAWFDTNLMILNIFQIFSRKKHVVEFLLILLNIKSLT